MKGNLLALLLVFSFSSLILAQEQYVQEKTKSKLESSNCNSFLKKSTKRIEKYTKRLKKINDAYLNKFHTSQQKFIESISQQFPNNAKLFANDAEQSKMRFEKLCSETSHHDLQNRNIEFERLESFTQMIKSDSTSIGGNINVNKHACAECDVAHYQKAISELKLELRRSELSKSYLDQRSQFINHSLGKDQLIGKNIDKITNNAAYHAMHLDNVSNIFSDPSALEKNFLELFGGHSTAIGSVASSEGQKVSPNLESKIPMSNNFDLKKFNEFLKKLPKALPERDSLNQIGLKAVDDKIDGSKMAVDSLSNLKKEKSHHKKDQKLNPLKTKRPIDRMTFSCTLQANERNAFFPTSGLLLVGCDYSLTKNFKLGLGATSVVGFASHRSTSIGELPAIHSGQFDGFGLRLNSQLRIKSSLFLYGCFEQNYRDKIAFANLSNYAKTESAQADCLKSYLIGLKYEYKSSSKKSCPTIEILYDLNNRNTGQPAFVVRTGISLKTKYALK